MLNNLKALNLKYKQDNLKSLLEAELKRQYEYEVNSRIINCSADKIESMIKLLDEPVVTIPVNEPVNEPVTIQSESNIETIEQAPVVKSKAKHASRRK